MNFLKKTLAVFFCAAMLFVAAFPIFASDSEIGTEANPENANDKYFSAAKCYLLNTDLEEGDTDGYWYTFTATGAGLLCIDATARDANDNVTENYQVTVTCNQRTYYAFDDIYTRPIIPFRVSRNDVLTIHMTATPDKNGVYQKTTIYCNITTAYGTETNPVYVKSEEGFVANIQALKSITYQDGTSGGLYGGKGIEITAHPTVIYNTEVTLNGVVYTDTDKDGKIELMLPGDPTAQIAVHPAFSIYNGSDTDASYIVKVVKSASEKTNVNHGHTLEYLKTVTEPTIKTEGLAIHYCTVCGETVEVSIPKLPRWTKGDLNNDSKINAVDTNILKRIMVGYSVSEEATDAADYNDDGEINAVDSFLMKSKLSGN